MTILEDFLGTKCSSCERKKQSSHSFCGRCYHILPADMQKALYQRFGNGYEAAFIAAQKYLEHPSEVPSKTTVAIKFPASSHELKEAGYEFDNEANCRGCGERMEWWITPAGRKMPMTVKKERDDILHVSAEVRIPHWADCPNAKDFKR